MCDPEFSTEREQDVVALIDLLLDLPPRPGACIAGALFEAAFTAQIIISLTQWLAALKAKALHIPLDEATIRAEKQVSDMMASKLLFSQIEDSLQQRRN